MVPSGDSGDGPVVARPEGSSAGTGRGNRLLRDLHGLRARQMLAAHPEIEGLLGRDPASAGWILLLFSLHVGMAWLLAEQSVWLGILAAFGLGALLSLGLWTLLHECTHDLVARHQAANKWLGIFAGLPLAIPAAASFRKFHLLHHRHMRDPVLDGDVPSSWETRWVGTSRLRRAAWLALMPLLIAIRPARMKSVPMLDKWLVINLVLQAIFDVTVVLLFGWTSFAYLLCSNLFCLGFHPLGGRWMQEHLDQTADQPTASYYGPVNRLAFNAGYHVEHHDIARIPWSRLPQLRAIAPEFYADLRSYRSWGRLFWEFLMRRDGLPWQEEPIPPLSPAGGLLVDDRIALL